MIQDGARLHYMVPRALHRRGLLATMFCDCYAERRGLAALAGRLLLPITPTLAHKILERRNSELDSARVSYSLRLAIKQRLARRNFATDEAYYLWVALRSGEWLLTKGFEEANAVYGFVRNVHPIVFESARARGLFAVADQMIAPATVEESEHQSQSQRWPGWERSRVNRDFSITAELETRTWAAVDHLTCGSSYVRDGLVSQGVDADKITVLPYAASSLQVPFLARSRRPGPLTVGFVGSVGLRKGAPYFFQIAKLFDPARVKFVMVGPIAIDKDVAAREKGAVKLVGPVPRSAIMSLLEQFDVFLFPSTCEGSAGAVLEAMASGLPIVCSPNSGSQVRDGLEGFLHPYDDVEAMAESIESLERSPDLRHTLGRAARARVESMNFDWYSQQLADLLRRILQAH
jgi:glycosyltransferase involved in cell wall biosynthesis